MSETLAIVGDGIAGPALARALAEQDVPSTLIVRRDLEDAPLFEPGTRTTTPVVREDVMQQLGIDTYGQAPIATGRFFVGDRVLNVFSKVLESRVRLADRPYYALDALQVSNQLLGYATESPKVKVVQGSVTDVDVTEGPDPRLIGLEVEGQEICTSLVFDATGRQATGVAGLVNSKLPGAVEITDKHQPTTYLGAYVQLEDMASSRHFSDADVTMSIGFLPSGPRIFLVPHRTEGSRATHLCFVAGDRAVISQEFRSARNHGGSNGNAHLAAVGQFTQNTIWQEVVDHAVGADRSVYFNYTNAQSRIPWIGGLAMIGDAQVHVNPTSGAGYRNMRVDISRFCNIVQDSSNFREAGGKFNDGQQDVCVRRMRNAGRVATAMKYGRVLGKVLF